MDLFLALVCLLYFWQRKLFRLQQARHEEDQERLQYLHQLELDKSEKEIVKLKNEKLEQEIGHKNKELASSAMHLVQKGELLGNIREELMRIWDTLPLKYSLTVPYVVRGVRVALQPDMRQYAPVVDRSFGFGTDA